MTRTHVLAFLIGAVALVESGVAFQRARHPVPDGDWIAATDVVRKELRPDDLVVFAPAWVDPVGREHLGDRMPVAMVARSDADAYARIWELSILDAHAEDTVGLAPAFQAHVGKVSVRRFDKPAIHVLRDLSADFEHALVATRRTGEGADEHPCPANGKARACGATIVEPRVMEIDYRPRRGILAPVIAGQIVSIAYDDVEGGALVGYAGLHDYYARKSADGIVLFRVHVDAAQTVTIPLRNDTGWKRFQLPLAPGKHHVVFEVQSDQPAQRLPGFHAEVRAP